MASESYIGKVVSLYANEGGCLISLDPPPTDIKKDGSYIYLPLTHKNYSSIYALLMASAANKIDIILRVDNTVTDDFPPINYAKLNFPR